jgi:hypothetical protein
MINLTDPAELPASERYVAAGRRRCAETRMACKLKFRKCREKNAPADRIQPIDFATVARGFSVSKLGLR